MEMHTTSEFRLDVLDIFQRKEILKFLKEYKDALLHLDIPRDYAYHVNADLININPNFKAIFALIEILDAEYDRTDWYIGCILTKTDNLTLIGLRYTDDQVFEIVKFNISRGGYIEKNFIGRKKSVYTSLNNLELKRTLGKHEVNISPEIKKGKGKMNIEDKFLFLHTLGSLSNNHSITMHLNLLDQRTTFETTYYDYKAESEEEDERREYKITIKPNEKYLKISHESTSTLGMTIQGITETLYSFSGHLTISESGHVYYINYWIKPNDPTWDWDNCKPILLIDERGTCKGLMEATIAMMEKQVQNYIEMRKLYTE